MSVVSSPEDAFKRLADMRAGFDRLRLASYEGRDEAGLARVTIDGTGLLTSLRLVPTIARHPADEVGEAVHAAVAAANQRRSEALAEFAGTAKSWWTPAGDDSDEARS
jgi:YbaB/EbfC DNA-binding family